MHLDPAMLSSASALMGALIGGGASLTAAVYTQRQQNRLQRVAQEVGRRETIYAEFLERASHLLLKAYVSDDIALDHDSQRLLGLMSRMRLFAPQNVLTEAEAMLKALIEISLKPGIEFRKLAMDALSDTTHPTPILKFSIVCRADLDRVAEKMA